MNRYILITLVLIATKSVAEQTSLSLDDLTIAELRQVREHCSEDVRSLCSGKRARGGELSACMTEKQVELSESCSGALETISAARDN